MIRRLTLDNWRNYSHADIRLQNGTTFVVASNGVGKTSFVEAARWALFGSSPITSPARLGTAKTSATVELVLPDDSVLTATRTWDPRKTRPTHHLTLTRDGHDLASDTWPDLCIDLYGCNPDILERLTMPTLETALPSGLGLREHLSALYGVDQLTKSATGIGTELRNIAKEISAVKSASAVKASELESLRAAVDTAAGRATEIGRAVVSAEATLTLARGREDQLKRAQERQQLRAQTHEAHAVILERLGALLGEPATADSATGALTRHLLQARTNLDSLRVEVQLMQRRRQDIEHDLAGLDSAIDDCPTCRRPLDDAARQHAHLLWRNELAELDEREAAARTAEPGAMERVAALEAAQRELTSNAQQLAAAARPIDETAIEAPSIADATQSYRMTAEAHALATEAHRRAENALQEANEANENMLRLKALFTKEARLEIAKNASEATRDEILSEIVAPLADAIDIRWASLFPNRGAVLTGPDGSISRQYGDHELTFESFSTAESTAAVIIMRLLVTQMTTRAKFAWFDEPLEHLDPDVRRNVANLLCRITAEDSLDQVVVTTYEEALARNLHVRSPNRTRLLDVRQEAPVDDQPA